MSSDRDKAPRPNPAIGSDLAVESAPLSERSRRASESAGQPSLAYATGPTNVAPAANVPTDMPPVIVDPAQPSADVSNVSLPTSEKRPARKATVRMEGAPVPPAPTSDPSAIEPPAASSGPHVLAGGPPPPVSRRNAKAQTIVVRRRRASPIEKAFAFAATLVLICTIGAAIFAWQRKKQAAASAPPPPPPAVQILK